MKVKKKALMNTLMMAGALMFLLGCTARVHVSGPCIPAPPGPPSVTVKAHPPGPAIPKPPPAPTPPTPPSIPVPPAPPAPFVSPTLDVGVVYVESTCPNTAEVLNGIDDDCDGYVDEDWVKSGPLQITLWWTGGPDLDLSVTDPKGKTISVKKKKSPSGGEMDKDSRSACKGGETIENIYWVQNPPKGTYKVLVNYYSTCGASKTNPPLVDAAVGISYNGQFIGPYTKQLTFQEKSTVIQFVIE